MIRVEPVSDVPWDDVRVVFGTRGDPATCWCQYFKVTNREFNETAPEQLERMLCEQVQNTPAGFEVVSRPGPGRAVVRLSAE